MGPSNVKDVVLAVTYRCNARCRMCSVWQRRDHEGEFAPDMVKNLPPSTTALNLTGGEPFLRGDLVEIVRVATENFPKAQIIISSNGFATDLIVQQMDKILAVNPRVGLAISVDGIGEAHDQIRGTPGGFDRLMATIKVLQARGVTNLRLAFTMGDYNHRELRKVYALSKEIGVEMTLAVVHAGADSLFGRDNAIQDKDALIEQLDWLVGQELSTWSPKHWARAYFTFGLAQFVRTGKRVLPDYSGQRNVFIDPLGDVYPCDIASEKIGTLEGLRSTAETVANLNVPGSWMICTARQAIKRHWIKVGLWIIRRKFLGNP
ncbi:MAG: radical SAM protein [Phycisphaerae bacterium]|jgi:MoaA/NifB/PqqE/SkfB family radical SAM enzyme